MPYATLAANGLNPVASGAKTTKMGSNGGNSSIAGSESDSSDPAIPAGRLPERRQPGHEQISRRSFFLLCLQEFVRPLQNHYCNGRRSPGAESASFFAERSPCLSLSVFTVSAADTSGRNRRIYFAHPPLKSPFPPSASPVWKAVTSKRARVLRLPGGDIPAFFVYALTLRVRCGTLPSFGFCGQRFNSCPNLKEGIQIYSDLLMCNPT